MSRSVLHSRLRMRSRLDMLRIHHYIMSLPINTFPLLLSLLQIPTGKSGDKQEDTHAYHRNIAFKPVWALCRIIEHNTPPQVHRYAEHVHRSNDDRSFCIVSAGQVVGPREHNGLTSILETVEDQSCELCCSCGWIV